MGLRRFNRHEPRVSNVVNQRRGEILKSIDGVMKSCSRIHEIRVRLAAAAVILFTYSVRLAFQIANVNTLWNPVLSLHGCIDVFGYFPNVTVRQQSSVFSSIAAGHLSLPVLLSDLSLRTPALPLAFSVSANRTLVTDFEGSPPLTAAVTAPPDE